MLIRPYKHSDYATIASWWEAFGEIGPQEGMMIEDGTFVLEIDEKLALSLTVFKTQSTIGYLEGYISDPELDKVARRKNGEELWNHCFNWARWQGIKVLICYNKPIFVERYEALGMTKSIGNLTSMFKTL